MWQIGGRAKQSSGYDRSVKLKTSKERAHQKLTIAEGSTEKKNLAHTKKQNIKHVVHGTFHRFFKLN